MSRFAYAVRPGNPCVFDGWKNYAGLFLFGYLLFNICTKIASFSTSDDDQRDPETIKQDEIWVSSFWNMNMNVVKWIKL